MEYKVIGGSFSPESLERAINNLAAEGWRGGKSTAEVECLRLGDAWGSWPVKIWATVSR